MKLPCKLPLCVGILLTASLLAACGGENYAQKRQREKDTWSKYVSDNHLELSTDSNYCFSHSTPWPENLYFQTNRGAYIRLIKDDTTKIHPTKGCTTIARYQAFDLSGNLRADNTNNTVSREGLVSVYSPHTKDPTIALNDAYACMHHETEAMILVDSQLGSSDQQSEVITLRFHIVDFTVKK